jgi:hypothetical protein
LLFDKFFKVVALNIPQTNAGVVRSTAKSSADAEEENGKYDLQLFFNPAKLARPAGIKSV